MKIGSARRIALVVSVLAGTACGITAFGEMTSAPRDDGGTEAGPPFLPDGQLPDGAPIGDGGGGPDADADASFDAQGRCLEVCDAGTCDAGTCAIDCTGVAACPARVVCPPDVPCSVSCTGTGACTEGVECLNASACNIDCTGTGACTNQPVACSGASCTVACGGTSACSQSVTCDAGTCKIGCTGAGSCQNQPVACNANVCSVQCGADAGGAAGKDACNKAVICNAQASCNIACVADDTCKNELVQATAPAVDVTCLDTNACTPGVAVSGKDASVTCRKNGACGNTIYCDAGKCTAACAAPENPTAHLCCAAGSTCVLDASACDDSKFVTACP